MSWTFQFSEWSPMDVTGSNQLLIRVKERRKYWIRVLDRQTGDLINRIPSMCNHDRVRVIKHSRHVDCMLENCFTCGEIRSYNINMTEILRVHKGPENIIMCCGPTGSLLVVDKKLSGLFKLDWSDDLSVEPQVAYKGKFPTKNTKFVRFHYTERYDVLICISKDEEIVALNFENRTVLWRLFGPVECVIIKPKYVTCDTEGNVYVSDLATRRILKINSLTGKVLGVLLFEDEEKNEEIQLMRWSNAGPNLTILSATEISTYFVPK